MQEHIVATFASDAAAAATARELEQIGIPASSIRRYRHGSEGTSKPQTATSNGGFWSWLLGEESGTADLPTYSRRHGEMYDERIGAGETVLAVTVADDSKIHRALEVVEAHDPLEIDEDTDETDGTAEERGVAPALGGAGQASAVGRNTSAMRATEAGVSDKGIGASSSGAGAGGRRGGDETIPLAEEEIEVGKRVVDRGTTRIRRYVVETPVERDLTLHGEQVTVERRRPTAASNTVGADAFEERTVEVHASEEEPVVQKNAHIAEEVVVHREDTERQVKVRDKLRRDEVDVSGDQSRTVGTKGR